MRHLWTKASVLGSLSASMAFGSLLWTQKNPEQDEMASGGCPVHTNAYSPYELKLVQVLFRHGARTPFKSIPNVMEAQWVPTLVEPPVHTQIKYVVTDLQGGPQPPVPVEDSYGSEKLTGGAFPGQLTAVGMQQLYDLGRRLKRRYIEETPFLSTTFSSEEVYVRSTNVVRTIESAKCLVAGLFEQKQNEVVPIVTAEATAEILYPNYHRCKLLKLLGGYRRGTLPDIAADLQNIQGALGIAPHQRISFSLIRDDLVARETHGLPLPPVLDTWRNTVEQRAVDMICHIYEPSKSFRESLQLCVGPLLHTMMGNIEETLQGTSSEPNRKLFLYSTHDTTLMPCLMAMGIFDKRWSPYGADITVELHQHRQTKEAFVKVSYIGQDQLLPGCSGVYCPLQEFKQALSAYSVNSELYQTLCNSTEGLTQP